MGCGVRRAPPVAIEVLTDPNISMLPAHITREQMTSFGNAMLKDDPERGPAIVQSVKGVIAGNVSGRPFKEDETADRHPT